MRQIAILGDGPAHARQSAKDVLADKHSTSTGDRHVVEDALPATAPVNCESTLS